MPSADRMLWVATNSRRRRQLANNGRARLAVQEWQTWQSRRRWL